MAPIDTASPSVRSTATRVSSADKNRPTVASATRTLSGKLATSAIKPLKKSSQSSSTVSEPAVARERLRSTTSPLTSSTALERDRIRSSIRSTISPQSSKRPTTSTTSTTHVSPATRRILSSASPSTRLGSAQRSTSSKTTTASKASPKVTSTVRAGIKSPESASRSPSSTLCDSDKQIVGDSSSQVGDVSDIMSESISSPPHLESNGTQDADLQLLREAITAKSDEIEKMEASTTRLREEHARNLQAEIDSSIAKDVLIEDLQHNSKRLEVQLENEVADLKAALEEEKQKREREVEGASNRQQRDVKDLIARNEERAKETRLRHVTELADLKTSHEEVLSATMIKHEQALKALADSSEAQLSTLQTTLGKDAEERLRQDLTKASVGFEKEKLALGEFHKQEIEAAIQAALTDTSEQHNSSIHEIKQQHEESIKTLIESLETQKSALHSVHEEDAEMRVQKALQKASETFEEQKLALKATHEEQSRAAVEEALASATTAHGMSLQSLRRKHEEALAALASSTEAEKSALENKLREETGLHGEEVLRKVSSEFEEQIASLQVANKEALDSAVGTALDTANASHSMEIQALNELHQGALQRQERIHDEKSDHLVKEALSSASIDHDKKIKDLTRKFDEQKLELDIVNAQNTEKSVQLAVTSNKAESEVKIQTLERQFVEQEKELKASHLEEIKNLVNKAREEMKLEYTTKTKDMKLLFHGQRAQLQDDHNQEVRQLIEASIQYKVEIGELKARLEGEKQDLIATVLKVKSESQTGSGPELLALSRDKRLMPEQKTAPQDQGERESDASFESFKESADRQIRDLKQELVDLNNELQAITVSHDEVMTKTLKLRLKEQEKYNKDIAALKALNSAGQHLESAESSRNPRAEESTTAATVERQDQEIQALKEKIKLLQAERIKEQAEHDEELQMMQEMQTDALKDKDMSYTRDLEAERVAREKSSEQGQSLLQELSTMRNEMAELAKSHDEELEQLMTWQTEEAERHAAEVEELQAIAVEHDAQMLELQEMHLSELDLVRSEQTETAPVYATQGLLPSAKLPDHKTISHTEEIQSAEIAKLTAEHALEVSQLRTNHAALMKNLDETRMELEMMSLQKLQEPGVDASNIDSINSKVNGESQGEIKETGATRDNQADHLQDKPATLENQDVQLPRNSEVAGSHPKLLQVQVPEVKTVPVVAIDEATEKLKQEVNTLRKERDEINAQRAKIESSFQIVVAEQRDTNRNFQILRRGLDAKTSELSLMQQHVRALQDGTPVTETSAAPLDADSTNGDHGFTGETRDIVNKIHLELHKSKSQSSAASTKLPLGDMVSADALPCSIPESTVIQSQPILAAISATLDPATPKRSSTDLATQARTNPSEAVLALEGTMKRLRSQASEYERSNRQLESDLAAAKCALKLAALRGNSPTLDAAETIEELRATNESLRQQVLGYEKSSEQLKANLAAAQTPRIPLSHHEDSIAIPGAIDKHSKSRVLAAGNTSKHTESDLASNEDASPGAQSRSTIATLEQNNKDLIAEIAKYEHACTRLKSELAIARERIGSMNQSSTGRTQLQTDLRTYTARLVQPYENLRADMNALRHDLDQEDERVEMGWRKQMEMRAIVAAELEHLLKGSEG